MLDPVVCPHCNAVYPDRPHHRPGVEESGAAALCPMCGKRLDDPAPAGPEEHMAPPVAGDGPAEHDDGRDRSAGLGQQDLRGNAIQSGAKVGPTATPGRRAGRERRSSPSPSGGGTGGTPPG